MEDFKVGERVRIIKLRNVENLRDLGGYPTQYGKTVRWGTLYRSGHLAKATTRDLEKISKLNLRTVIDFRSTDERIKRPNRLPFEQEIKLVNLPILDDFNANLEHQIRTRIRHKTFDEFNTVDMMTTAYRQFAIEFVEEYRQFMQEILEAKGEAVLWNCRAGKDRTGFAAVILLKLLGVDEELAIQDYLLSSQYVSMRPFQMSLLTLIRGKQATNLVRPLLGVKEGWIRTALAAIDEHWGGFDQYITNGLKLKPADIQALQGYFIE